MNKTYFTVGPSQSYPTVAGHIQKALKDNIHNISHRGAQFAEIYQNTQNNLRALLSIPADHRIYFMGSATEGMERIIQNTVEKKSFHFVNGAFSARFYQTALDLGKFPEKVEVPFGSGFTKNLLKIRYAPECICITQAETSTGASFPMDDVYFLRKNNPDTLIALDVVSAIPYVDINYDLVDMTFLSIQKGFGLPAGLGVLTVSPRALEKAQYLHNKGISIGSYHSFISFEKYYQKLQTPETPNVLDIYLLEKVSADMIKYGIDKIRKQTDEKAGLIYDFFDRHPVYKPFVTDPKARSATTITIDTPGQTTKVVSELASKGFIIGRGYGKFKEDKIRVANFPAHTVSDVKSLLHAFSVLK